MSSITHSRRVRWVAPLVVIAVIGLLAFIPTISAGADTPSLPDMTPQALLAKVRGAKPADLPGLAGTIKLSANLGIPSLGGLSGAAGGNAGFSPTDLLSGVHSADVWASKDGFKATYSDSPLSEDDVITNGKDLWTWQSRGTKVTHVVLPSKTPSTEPPSTPEASSGVKTPDEVAQSLLDKLTPSSVVTVSTPAFEANNRAAYELVLTPRSDVPANAASTVDHIAIAVDNATGLPIRVEIFAKGQAAAAFDFGFSRLDVGAQSLSTFTFSPPAGASVTTKVMSSGAHTAKPTTPDTTTPDSTTPDTKTGPTVVGQDWTTVSVFHPGEVPQQVISAIRAAAGKPDGTGPTLLSTALINVLVLDNGNVAVGAVNATALQAAASSVG